MDGRLIAIAGGIGCGKSVVARMLTAMGYHVFDCDTEARRLMEGSDAIKKTIREKIDGEAVDGAGRIDRARLGETVFADPEKLKILNSAVHGAVKERLKQWRRENAGERRLFVETAILYQSGLDKMVDEVWEVSAPMRTRIIRVCRRNGLKESEVMARIEAQDFKPDNAHERVRLLINDGDEPLLPQIEALLEETLCDKSESLTDGGCCDKSESLPDEGCCDKTESGKGAPSESKRGRSALMPLYSMAMSLCQSLINLLGGCFRSNSKTACFIREHRRLRRQIEATVGESRVGSKAKMVWVHAASLGEYGVVRPLIDQFKSRGYEVTLTFFSATGYEHLKESHPGIDYMFYLPIDSRRNARSFVEAVRPDIAVFAVSEYWLNLLGELHRRGVPTYLVAAKIVKRSVFFKWYGGAFRRALKDFRHIYAIDAESIDNLRELGIESSTTCPNPLFDNAYVKAHTEYHDAVIDSFTGVQKMMIAGSLHTDRDLDLVSELINRHPDDRFIVVPHETDAHEIAKIRERLKGSVVCHSECVDRRQIPEKARVLIIDFVGALAYIYRYGDRAYIGGGFTPYLHSLIEATVYGLPVAFGPQIGRKITPRQLIERGLGESLSGYEALEAWYERTGRDDSDAQKIRKRAVEYVEENLGAAKRITDDIIKQSGKER